jgi:hypothetical protein
VRAVAVAVIGGSGQEMTQMPLLDDELRSLHPLAGRQSPGPTAASGDLEGKAAAARRRGPWSSMPTQPGPWLLVGCSDVAKRFVTWRHHPTAEPAESRTNRHRLTPRALI